MQIKKLIKDTLTPLGIPVAFLTRKDTNEFPFIVYNIYEKGNEFADDNEESIMYDIMITLFSKDNFEILKDDTINLLLNAGFIKVDIPPTIYVEEIDVYNQPMNFRYYYYK